MVVFGSEISDLLADAQRLSVSCIACSELWHHYSAYWWQGMWLAAGAMLILCMVLFSRHSNFAIATPMVTIGQWLAKRRPFSWWFARRERASMAKDRFEERTDELSEEICDWIESKRTSTLWSDDDCDIEYARLKSRFPVFRYAVDNPGRVREAIKGELERRRKERKQRQKERDRAPAPSFITRPRTA